MSEPMVPAGEAGPGQLYLYCADCLYDTPDSNVVNNRCRLCGSSTTALFYRHPEDGDGYYEWAEEKKT